VPEPLIPELPLPEPLLPDPEVWASTNGAVTTSTARAANTFLLHLLNISLFSYNLEGCACLVSRFEPYSPALHSAGEPCPEAKEQFLCQRHAQDSAPSAMPSCGIARSYFESRRRQHSCKNRASKFSQNENTQYEQSRQNPLAEQSALPLHYLLQFIEEAPIGTSDNGHYVTHSLALRNEIRTWCVVREGRYHKKGGFFLNQYC
jgi:hypothetical protein